MCARLLLVLATLALTPSIAYAVDGPAPGAASPSKVKLPDSPASVHGLAGPAEVQVASAQISYSVPFELPSGGGLTPVLGLGYRGDLGNGSLGVGWMLEHAAIVRSTRHGVPHFDDTDELEISGLANGRLIRISDGSYRVEGSGNASRIIRSGNRWTFTDKDGTAYYFGLTANSRQETTNGVDVRTTAWYPELVVHLSGKTISYQYLHDQGQVYLSRATWGPLGKYHVDFTYGPRPDVVTSYREGLEVVTALRLSTIAVFSGGSSLRTYLLTYDESFSLTRLHAVMMTGLGGAGSLPTVTFTYAGRNTSGPLQVTGLDGWQLNARGVSLFDVDGDGMDDLLRLEAGNHEFRKNLGGTFGPAQSLTGASGIPLEHAELLDLDGDARPELVHVVDDTWRAYQLDATTKQWKSLGEWPGTSGVPLGVDGVLADLDGDGRTDVVRGTADSLLVNLNSASGLGPTTSLPPISSSDVNVEPGLANVRFTDLNGDGLVDVVWITDGWMKEFLGRGDGTFVPWRRVFYPWPASPIDPKNLLLEDLDRDGLADLILLTAGHVAYYAAKPDGGFSPPQTFARPEDADSDVVVTVADANGNGSLDVIWSSPRGMWILDLAGPTSAGMIRTIDNGLGQVTSFDYQASAVLAAGAAEAGQPWLQNLPISIPVPTRTQVNISGEPTRTVVWGVRDGLWDASERRFGGFLETRKIVAGATAQDTFVTISQQLAGIGSDRELRGRTNLVRTENGLGDLHTETLTNWEAFQASSLANQDLLRIPISRSVVTRNYEGVTTPLSTVKYVTVDAEGRTIEEYNAGRIDLDGDETRVTRVFAVDDDVRWIRNRVCEEATYSGDGRTLLSSTRHYFGGPGPKGTAVEPLCSIGLGLERQMDGILDTRWVTLVETDYDSHWNPVRTLADGIERAFTYDFTGQYLASETVAPNDLDLTYTMTWDQIRDLPTSVIDPSGVDTRMTYDSLGRPETVALGDHNPHVHYQYDWSSPRPKTATFTFAGDVTQTPPFPGVYMPAQWRENIVVSNGAGESLFTAARAASSQWVISNWRERDDRGRVVVVADPFYWNSIDAVSAILPPLPHPRQTLAYDAFDRQVLQTLPTGAQKATTFTAFEMTSTTDGLAPIVSQLDGLGRIRRTTRIVSGITESVSATYDSLGQITALHLQDQQPNAVDHTFEYDTLGRLVFADDPDSGARTLAYDDAGRLLTHTNGASDVVSYTYDSAGRLRTRSSDNLTFTYHYDTSQDDNTFTRTKGRLAWVEEPTGSIQIGYDELGRASRLRRIVNGQTADEVSSLSASGKALAIDYLDGASFAMQYDDADRLTAVGDLWTLDSQDASGRILGEHFGNGVTSTYVRDSLGQPAEISVSRSSSILYHTIIDHNSYGAITSINDTDGAGLDHTATFNYDGGARIVSATLGSGAAQLAFAYAYDGLQNMTSRVGGGNGTLLGQYHYGEAPVQGGSPRGPRQLTSVSTSAGLITLDYDGAGRQTRQGPITLTYNALDQLVSVSGLPGSSGDPTYGYGYDGARVFARDPTGATQVWFTPNLTQTNGVRDHYVRLGDRLIAKLELNWTGDPGGADTNLMSGGLVVRSSSGSDVSDVEMPISLIIVLLFVICWKQPRKRRVSPTRFALVGATIAVTACSLFGSSRDAVWHVNERSYYHQGVGAGPTIITREDGSVLEERRYEPFGDDIDAYRESSVGSGSVGLVDFTVETHGITNKPTDPTTGWSYHGSRWMAPETGRWLSPDPSVKMPDGKFMSKPWGLNPYQYAENNPTLYWDPDGNDIYFVVRTNNRDVDVQAQLTREWAIRRSPNYGSNDIVISIAALDLGELKTEIERNVREYSPKYGKTKELTVGGHASAKDGPRGEEWSANPLMDDHNQLSKEGWADINFNWAPYSIAVFNGCNTMPWVKSTFIKAQPGVTWAAGYVYWSYFTTNPTGWAPWDGGNGPDGGIPDVYPIGTDSSNWIARKALPQHGTAIPMSAITPTGTNGTVWPTDQLDYSVSLSPYSQTDMLEARGEERIKIYDGR